MTQFHADSKEALFRVLKESASKETGVDLCLYTRGGDTNAVWPIVNVIREFDPDFEVLVPFRCHSSGTLVALGGKCIHLGPISELSPIDPSTGNQFNPLDPTAPGSRLPISVEDVQAYRTFVLESMHENTQSEKMSERAQALYVTFLQKLAADVHPLALGNVHYEDQFQLRRTFVLSDHMADKPEDTARFIGAAVESRQWSYLFETKAKINQNSKLPPNVQLQLPAGQRMPLIPGLPREYHIEVTAQGWIHNKGPKGVTL